MSVDFMNLKPIKTADLLDGRLEKHGIYYEKITDEYGERDLPYIEERHLVPCEEPDRRYYLHFLPQDDGTVEGFKIYNTLVNGSAALTIIDIIASGKA